MKNLIFIIFPLFILGCSQRGKVTQNPIEEIDKVFLLYNLNDTLNFQFGPEIIEGVVRKKFFRITEADYAVHGVFMHETGKLYISKVDNPEDIFVKLVIDDEGPSTGHHLIYIFDRKTFGKDSQTWCSEYSFSNEIVGGTLVGQRIIPEIKVDKETIRDCYLLRTNDCLMDNKGERHPGQLIFNLNGGLRFFIMGSDTVRITKK